MKGADLIFEHIFLSLYEKPTEETEEKIDVSIITRQW